MNILSWNVNGIKGRRGKTAKGKQIRSQIRHISKVNGLLDIVELQEHHLNQEEINVYGGSFIGNTWEYFWGLGHGDNHSHGGVCMYINKKWSNLILQKEIIIEGRPQFMVIQFDCEKVSICNLYASNFAAERAQFWRHLRRVLTATNISHWCLAGDFNMLEDPADRTGGRGRTIYGQELLEWEKLLFSLGITDVWALLNLQQALIP